jgi:hypothetical protein
MTHRPARPLSEIATKPTFRTIDGVSIRFAESEPREPIWSRLAERAHLVAIVLPGFGRSERRDE